MKYSVEITPRMKEVNDFLISNFEGMDHCQTVKGRNLILEVPKKRVKEVVMAMRQGFGDVAELSHAYQMLDVLHDFILVKALVTESPVVEEKGIMVPTLEKELVDAASDKENACLSEGQVQFLFQKAFEQYSPNRKRMLRYAARKGEKEQIERRLAALDDGRLQMIAKIRDYLAGKPIEKAWLFGSFSRQEERPDSDVDILFTASDKNSFSLLDHIGIRLDLEDILERKVDLVTEGTLLPYAAKTAEQDKYLIYERAN